MAAPNFEDLLFMATGGTAPRSSAERFADIVNVLDFGADRTGSTNSNTAIQAAIDRAATLGSNVSPNRKGGIVFFPPGSYLLTTAMTFPGSEHTCIMLVGCGARNTFVKGNFTGFLFDKADDGFNSLVKVAGLGLYNFSTSTSSGALRVLQGETCEVAGCLINATNGVHFGPNVANGIIRLVDFETDAANAIGAFICHGGIYNSDFSNIGGSGAECVRIGGSGVAVMECRMEVSNIAIMVGKNAAGSAADVDGIVLASNQFESNFYSFWLKSMTGGFIGGNWNNAFNDAAPGGGDPQTALHVENMENVVVVGNGLGGNMAVAGVDLSAATGENCQFSGNYTAISGGAAGTAWKLPASGVPPWCDFGINTFLSPELTFATLPSSDATGRYVGRIVNVSDADTSGKAYGDAITAGGSSAHIAVRWNGTNWRWIG